MQSIGIVFDGSINWKARRSRLNVIFPTFEYIRITLVRINGISTGILWNLKLVASSWYGLTCSVFEDLNGAIKGSKKGNYVEFHWLEICRVRGVVIKNVRRPPVG